MSVDTITIPPVIYWMLATIGLVWAFVLYSMFKKLYGDWIDMREEQAYELEQRRLKEFNPEPLVNEFPRHAIDRPLLDPECGNFVRLDFLSFSQHDKVSQSAIDTIRHYGVGSCSPPAFFGTSDLHMIAVDKLTAAFGAADAVLYSWGTLTVSSVIASYVESNDTVFMHVDTSADIHCFLKTMNCSISKYTSSNNLETLLTDRPYSGRPFFVLEGIYATTGRICDLPVYVALVEKFKVRLILDESFSFGVLGEHGGGILEYYNLEFDDVDVICGSLEPVWGVVGGFSVASKDAIDVQQLQSKAYLYTAALPPFLVQAFLTAYEMCAPRQKVLEQVALDFDGLLRGLPELKNLSSPRSPRKVLGITDAHHRSIVFKLCRDEYKVYLDVIDQGLVINLFHDLILPHYASIRKRVQEALDHASRILRNDIVTVNQINE